MWPNYAFHVPEQKKLRYIVHTDCKKRGGQPRTRMLTNIMIN